MHQIVLIIRHTKIWQTDGKNTVRTYMADRATWWVKTQKEGEKNEGINYIWVWELVYIVWDTYFFLPRPDPGPNNGRLPLNMLVTKGRGLISATGGGGGMGSRSPGDLSISGQPDSLWWAVSLPVTWPEPSHPGVGHFLKMSAPCQLSFCALLCYLLIMFYFSNHISPKI